MSEIRKDPLSSTWIVLSTERKKRPSDFWEEKSGRREADAKPPCPFCGEEMTTPPVGHAIWPGEIDKETKQWLTRILPNKFPALRPSLELMQTEISALYHMLSGVGGHEVLVDSPNHDETLATMSVRQIEAILRTYTQRYKFWRNDPRIAYVLIFKNYKPAAGASLTHPHSQLIATPIIPPRVFEELDEARRYYEQNKECVYCAMIKMEKESKESRLVYENETMLACCPFASRFPGEIRILPKRHQAALEEMTPNELKDLTDLFFSVFKKLAKVLDDPPFNYIIHVGPTRTPGLLYYHWHIEVIPRLAMPAGFEWGTGIYINTLSPEEVAQALREA